MQKLYKFIISAVLIFLATVSFSGCGESGLEIKTVGETEEDSASEAATESELVEAVGDATTEEYVQQIVSTATNGEPTIYVYVCGAVKEEGVYELPVDSRVEDALEMAGGYSDEALHGYVNLAERLEDEDRVYIPNLDDLEELGIISVDQDSDNGSDSTGDSLVNINTADVSELTQLPGIGEAKAQAIIAYRDEHGAFGSIEEIKNVSGIGEGIYNKLSSYIKVN